MGPTSSEPWHIHTNVWFGVVLFISRFKHLKIVLLTNLDFSCYNLFESNFKKCFNFVFLYTCLPSFCAVKCFINVNTLWHFDTLNLSYFYLLIFFLLNPAAMTQFLPEDWYISLESLISRHPAMLNPLHSFVSVFCDFVACDASSKKPELALGGWVASVS